MKSKIFLSMVVITAFFIQQAQAKVWRVNNKSNYDGATLWGGNFGGTAAYPVFAQVDQAVAFGIVNDDDTIHLEGSTVTYTLTTITKKLVIIGTGYFLTNNPATSNNTLVSSINRIYFNEGSQGSQVIGCNVINAGNGADGVIYVNVNDITVKRCRIERAVQFATLLSDVIIVQNFFPNTIVSNALFTNGNGAFVPPTDIIFNNNICQKALVWGASGTNPVTLWPILQCNNNVFDGPDNLATPNLAFSTSEFRNNILMPTNAVTNIAASAGTVTHNIGTLVTQFGNTDNNLVIPGISSVFIVSASPDGAYQVDPASTAHNSGSDNTDRGAFGGTAVSNHYTLSGLAPVPVIYNVTTAGVATPTGLQVSVKARIIK